MTMLHSVIQYSGRSASCCLKNPPVDYRTSMTAFNDISPFDKLIGKSCDLRIIHSFEKQIKFKKKETTT